MLGTKVWKKDSPFLEIQVQDFPILQAVVIVTVLMIVQN